MGNTPAKSAEPEDEAVEILSDEKGKRPERQLSSSVPEFGANLTASGSSGESGGTRYGASGTTSAGLRNFRKSSLEASETVERQKVPIVLKWENGGKNVMVAGSFSNWEKIPMSESHDNFAYITDLTEGAHEYKFHVDGQWIHDPSEPTTRNAMGTLNNIVRIDRADLDALDLDLEPPEHPDSTSPPGEYRQEIPEKILPGVPPQLPRLLHQVPLNSEIDPRSDPTVLPTPDHVLINHLYALSIKDGVMVLAATQRYQNKFVTTLLYKPVQ